MIVHEKGVEDSWKECMKRLMNEDGEWEHGVSAEVKGGGPAGCIEIGGVVAALKKMKGHGAPGLSGLSVEMIRATENVGTRWLLDL